MSSSCDQKHFTQCFWQATGELVCENVVVPDKPPSYQEFNTFSTPNSNYNPNAYLQNVDWYNKRQAPCCNVPCECPCKNAVPSPLSPPRDFSKNRDLRFQQ